MGKSHRLTKEQRENLVAFIDGELEEETVRDLEKTLSDNPVASHEIDVLKKTWGMLDYLDRPEASETVIEQTITSIQVQNSSEGKFVIPAWWNQVQQSIAYVVAVAGILSAITLGYMTATKWIPSQSDEIARDLQLLEDYDQLQEVGSLAFLEMLQDKKLVNEIKNQSKGSPNSMFHRGHPFGRKR